MRRESARFPIHNACIDEPRKWDLGIEQRRERERRESAREAARRTAERQLEEAANLWEVGETFAAVMAREGNPGTRPVRFLEERSGFRGKWRGRIEWAMATRGRGWLLSIRPVAVFLLTDGCFYYALGSPQGDSDYQITHPVPASELVKSSSEVIASLVSILEKHGIDWPNQPTRPARLS